ncbi:putative reverse transcriptase domain-containing protein [Tanacetum coccineum]
MDLLSKLRAKLVCFEKIVQILLSNGEILEVHGEHPKGNLKQLKTMKVDELKLEDIPVVRNFPSVFPEDLSGLPPPREVDFRIDLIPGAMLVAKSPYRLAPMEMQELSNQLKKLQDKVARVTIFLKNRPLIRLSSVESTQEDIPKTAFRTRYGHFEFTVMPFSLTNAPARNKVIAYASRQLKIHEENYTTHDLELGAVARILEAQREASKGTNTPTEMLKGLDKQFERKEDGGLYLAKRIWVPIYGNLRTLIMNEAHTSTYYVHPGADKMYYDLQDLCWWPGMKKDIALYVSKCLTCSKVKGEHQKPSGLLQQPEIPEWKWENITMDFIKTERLARLYINEIIARHGVPVSILSVRDSHFTSRFWRSLQKALGTQLNQSTAYHPQTNGQSEHTIQTLEDMLRACAVDFGGNWDTHLLLVEFSYNNSYHSSETTDKVVQIKKRLKTARDRQKSYANNRRMPLEFSVGDKVLLKVSP